MVPVGPRHKGTRSSLSNWRLPRSASVRRTADGPPEFLTRRLSVGGTFRRVGAAFVAFVPNTGGFRFP